MSKKTTAKEFWDSVEVKEEWCNFIDRVPIDVIVEEAKPKTVETPFGPQLAIVVQQFPRDSFTGGFKKYLKIESKRLRAGIKNSSPQGIPASGNGYRITRFGEGFATTYNVEFIGQWSILPGGRRAPLDTESTPSPGPIENKDS